MKKALFVALSLLTAASAWSYYLLEDFQSYSDGEDIATSSDWTLWTPPNQILCEDLGGDEKVGVFHNAGGEDWCYFWVPTETDRKLDYGISVDFVITEGAGDSNFGWSMRCIFTSCYMTGIHPALNPPEIELRYWDGYYDYLYTLYLDESIMPDEWHNFCCHVFGEDAVYFDFFFDGEKVGDYIDYTYLQPEGHTSLVSGSMAFDGAIYVDNITQEEPYNPSVQPVTLGQIKSLFH